jgi:glutathione S-transferase
MQDAVQGAMYRDMDIAERAALIKRIAFQLDVLNSLIKGPYVSGSSMGLADAALFPTLTFCNFMLPQFFGWKQAFKGKQLQAYWDTMRNDVDAAKVSRKSCL